MRKFLLSALLTLGIGFLANAAMVTPVTNPVVQICSTISPGELSKMSPRDFEKIMGRSLSKEEKSEFKVERLAARKKMKNGFWGGEGFPWRSVIIGVLLITVTLILVL